MKYFNANSEYCNRTLQHFVYNLTSSYADQRNEASMVATSVIMFALATLFFNLNLFSRFSDISAILNPSVRLFLSTSLSLFLPVMSYLFSEAKNEDASTGEMAELSLRARIILMWMLLVELLRKKVEAILVSAGVQGYSGTIEHAARIAWLGYLVFHNLRSAGKKALYGILWVLAAAKLVQRFVTLELAKRSFAYGKNPQLIASYMTQMLKEEQHTSSNGHSGSVDLKWCNYVVLGEEDLEKKAGPNGYDLQPDRLIDAIKKDDSTVVTVGKIWKLAETDQLLQSNPRLKSLCLSFALYKLLRRRLEDFPITDADARNCHDVIFKCFGQEHPDGAATSVALFQVFNDEVQFLCEYYHSVQPVVLASPFFFLVNYILFPIFIWAFCALTIILCSNGDVHYAFHSFSTDNYAVSFGIMKMIGCIVSRVTKSPQNLFSTVDISITILLFLAFVYEEVWEFIVFLLSNWFMVSLLCSYTSKPRWRKSPLMSGIIRRILWVQKRLSHPNVCFKQFSVLSFCRLSSADVPTEAKKTIMERLANVSDVAPLSPSNVLLQSEEYSQLLQSDGLLSLCDCRAGVAEVILTWHIATALLEAKHPLRKPTGAGADRKVATTLSRYCAYVVAFHPELLPDDKDGTERVYEDTMSDLKKELGCWGYYCYPQATRSEKLMEIAGQQHGEPAEEAVDQKATASALRKGARLGKVLVEKATDEAARERVWKLLADLWTEVVVYAAPTASQLHVKAHKEALAQGGEFITVLWALVTHTGIVRPAGTPPACV
ncbi:uncharacterized protein LOC133925417 [Phragmites australis]|uniref:uncharacterized protein LOC133925417 n=1 Tax=Phragmites australis TaxID=29695 RepID=UPI002D76AA7C|nr:uncharacterized protein LOC133925417 [Phragmites australis]